MIKLVLVLLFLVVGCKENDDFLYHANPPRQQTNDDDFKARELFANAKIDILFVIDNSGSMGSIQQNIVKNSKLFMENFLKNNEMNWRMGIISTDQMEPPYLGFNPIFDNKHAMITPHHEVVKTFKDAVNELGVSGDVTELVFYNVHRVMTDPRYERFFRDDAHLAIIMVTDEREQSEKEMGGLFEANSFLNTIRSTRIPGKILRFYGAFNLEDLAGCRSSIEPPYKGSAYEAVIKATAGIHMSACTKDFGKGLAEIGKDIISIVDSPKMLLRDRPIIETLKVFYNDKIIPGGAIDNGGYWYYSEKHSTINFYNLDFMDDRENGKIRIVYDVDDGIDRVNEFD